MYHTDMRHNKKITSVDKRIKNNIAKQGAEMYREARLLDIASDDNF